VVDLRNAIVCLVEVLKVTDGDVHQGGVVDANLVEVDDHFEDSQVERSKKNAMSVVYLNSVLRFDLIFYTAGLLVPF
jgi:hypothetical protein